MSAHHHLLHRLGVSGLRLRVRAGWAREDLDRRLARDTDPAADPLPEPRPRGVAMAERLLIDPNSPLYAASSSDEVTRAARDAAECLRGDEHPAEPREHRFCIPTVAPIPPQPLVESSDW